MCDIRSGVAKLFRHYSCCSNNNTMQSNSCVTEVEDVGVIIEPPENTGKKVHEKYQTVSDSSIKILDDGQIKCNVCKCDLPSIDHILAHIEGKQHENNLNQPSLIEPPENTDKKVHEKYQTVLDSNIKILDDGKIKCKVCKCGLPSIDHILAHIEGKQHENNLKLSENTTCSEKDKQTLSNHDTVLKNDVVYCKVCEKQFDSMFSYSQHVPGKRHMTQLKKHQTKDSEYDVHANNVGVDKLTENLIEELIHKTKHDHKEVDSNMYDCELCNERMNINDLFAHINTHRDDQSLNTAKILYKCVCCKSIIDGNTSFICHIRKKTHLHNFRNFFKHTEAGNIETHATNKGQNASEENNSFVFTILSPKVKKTSAHFEEKCLISFDKIHYSCIICSAKLSGIQSVILHCETKMHQLNIEQLFSGGKVEKNNDSAVWSLLNCFYELSIIDSNKTIQSSDASDTDLTMSNAVCEQIMEKIQESPLISNSGSKNKRHIIKPKEKLLTDRLNKPYSMKYFQLEKEMYTLTKKKIDEIKLYFKFFIPYDKHIYCMVCKTKVSRNLYLLYEHTRLLLHRANVKIETENNVFIEQYIKIDIPKDEKESTQESKQESTQESKQESCKKPAEIVATCQVCKVPIKSVASIMLHIERSVHKQNYEKNDDFVNTTVDSILKNFSDLYYSIQRFICVGCNIKFTYKIEFLEHICKRHKNILQKRNYMFDFCIPCATLWLSKSDSYEGHCNDIVHKYLLKSNDFMVEDVPKCIINMLKQVDGMMQFLLKETKRVTEDHIHEEVRKSLETKAKLCYSQAKAFIFGSRYIGLGFKNCDIDIYIDTGNKYSVTNNEVNKELLRIQEAISIDEDAWEIKEMLLKCRVPIIKLIYKPRNLDCDVSFLNGLSVEKSKLLRSFNNVCLPCKKLTLFIKKWLSFINLRGGHGFSNYVLYWLVIYYLQEKEHLPSVAELIKENGSSEFIGDWQIGFASVKCKNNHEDSVTVLLQGFFEFYGNFDYQSYIVCPLMGSLIAKTDFTELNKLPRAMDAYIKHLKTNSKPEFFRIDSPLCVQDPLALSHNAAKAVSSITLKYFRQYCKECAAILKLKVN